MRSRMLLQVHDELVFETDEDELSALADLAVEVMEGALPLDVPLEVDLKVGANWEQMDRYLREDGRRVPKSAGDVAREEAEEEAPRRSPREASARSAAPPVLPARSFASASGGRGSLLERLEASQERLGLSSSRIIRASSAAAVAALPALPSVASRSR